MESELNPLGQFFQEPPSHLQRNHSKSLNFMSIGFFQGFDEISREDQNKKFGEMMQSLKDYITDNRRMDEYFEVHDKFTKEFSEKTNFEVGIQDNFSGKNGMTIGKSKEENVVKEIINVITLKK